MYLDHTSFIDGYIRPTHVMIEQKSLGKDLRKAIRQSDVSLLNPFQQAKRYSFELPYDDRPRWIITCNFAELLVYDMNKPNSVFEGNITDAKLNRLKNEVRAVIDVKLDSICIFKLNSTKYVSKEQIGIIPLYEHII